MSNLIPVKRPDRNGKIVTKWVRKDSGSDIGVTLPAPAIGSTEKSVEAVRGELYRALVNEYSNQSEVEYWERQLTRVPENALVQALGVARQHSTHPHVIASLKSALKIATPGMESILRDRIAFSATECYDDSPSAYNSAPDTYSASVDYLFPDRHWSKELTEQELHQAVSIGHTLAAIQEYVTTQSGAFPRMQEKHRYVVQHPELVELAKNNPEQAERLGEFIAERGTDPILAQEFIENENKALGSGML